MPWLKSSFSASVARATSVAISRFRSLPKFDQVGCPHAVLRASIRKRTVCDRNRREGRLSLTWASWVALSTLSGRNHRTAERRLRDKCGITTCRNSVHCLRNLEGNHGSERPVRLLLKRSCVRRPIHHQVSSSDARVVEPCPGLALHALPCRALVASSRRGAHRCKTGRARAPRGAHDRFELIPPAPCDRAVLVIGDEILSGRTKDKNIGYFAEYLTGIGSTSRWCGWLLTTRRLSSRRSMLARTDDYVFTTVDRSDP